MEARIVKTTDTAVARERIWDMFDMLTGADVHFTSMEFKTINHETSRAMTLKWLLRAQKYTIAGLNV
jgi:hypothetical protein